MSVLFISPKVLVDFNDDGDFIDANEDVSADVVGLDWQRGRASVNDDFGMGTATVTLNNSAGTYSPFDTGSATYPNMVPGRPVSIELTHNSIDYPQFYGRLARVSQSRSPSGAPLVTLHLEDEFGRMGRSRYRSHASLTVEQFIDSVLTQVVANIGILEDYGYNAAGYSVETSQTTLAHGFHSANGSHLDAARLAAHQELGGAFFMAADGKPTFYNRLHNSSEAVHATFTGVQALDMEMRQSDYYDTVVFKRAGITVEPTETALFQLFPIGREMAPGSTDERNTFHGRYITSAATVTQPAANTNWTFNALQDGTGQDLTNQVSVSSWATYGSAFSITFDNASGQTAYLRSFTVDGLAQRVSDESREVVVTDASAPVTNQALRDEFVFNDNEDEIRAFALVNLRAGTTFYPRRMKTRHVPRTDAEAVSILGFELLKRLTITNTTGLYPTKINEDFFIQSIRGKAIPGGLVEINCTLWHEIASFGNFFRISGASGGGADYSTIVAGGATAGDPIAL